VSKTRRMIFAAASVASALAFASAASAQYSNRDRGPGYAPPPPLPYSSAREEFRHGEFREHHGHHRYGHRCHHRVSAEGHGHADFYGGPSGGRKAQTRAIRHWSEQVAARFGGHLASWDRASGREVRCDRRGADYHCVASGHPCH
jgi:hypothetical protein